MLGPCGYVLVSLTLSFLIPCCQCEHQSTDIPDGRCDSEESCQEVSSRGPDRLQEKMTSVKEALARDGVAVIPGVLTPEECDSNIAQLHQWLDKFSQDRFPGMGSSLVQAFNIGYHSVAWMTRLKSTPIFESLWGTDKLTSSIDAMAIGRPPELGYERFADDGRNMWLHLDQGQQKDGLHAYQGAVYLEDAEEDDWCLAVMNGSHKYHKKFFAMRNKPTPIDEYLELKEDELKWYKEKGCHIRKVSVPKGGMVLWDSRTVHAGSRPERNRNHPGRWRYVVFVCMAPAIWANADEMTLKKNAYKEMLLTTHWAAQGFETFYRRPVPAELNAVNKLPDIAKTEKARLLAGDLEYDFNDGKPNGGSRPVIH